MSRLRETFSALALPALTSALVLASGVLALRQADPRGALRDLFPGTYQRLYEDRFEAALPFRNFAQQGWSALRLAAFGEAQAGALVGAEGWLFTLEEFVAPQDAPDLATELTYARDQLAARGIALVPVIVPDKARMVQGLHRFPRAAEIEDRFDAALGVLAELGLPAIDTRLALAPLGPTAYLRTDTHWSPQGAQATALALARALPDLVQPGESYVTRPDGVQALEGDLTVFVDTGPFAAWVGPRPETIARFETVSTGSDMGLFGDAEIPVALIGTSFSARGDLHFDGFLKSALGQDVLNLSEQGQGPFAPMRRFLASPEPTFTPLRTVIWEIPERYITTRRET